MAIGTSTGGPVALQRVLTQLPGNFPAPIVLIQHMPAAFTKAFAERLDGGRYIDVDIQRAQASRYGLNIADVQSVISSAVGGPPVP